MRLVIRLAGLFVLGLGMAPLISQTAIAADTIVFGAAISVTGKTAKEGEYTRDGYQFAIDTINQQGGIKVGNKTYKAALKYYDDESKSERTAQLVEKLVNAERSNSCLGPTPQRRPRPRRRSPRNIRSRWSRRTARRKASSIRGTATPSWCSVRRSCTFAAYLIW